MYIFQFTGVSVNCPVCGDQPTIKELIDYEDFCGLKEPENAGANCRDNCDRVGQAP